MANQIIILILIIVMIMLGIIIHRIPTLGQIQTAIEYTTDNTDFDVIE